MFEIFKFKNKKITKTEKNENKSLVSTTESVVISKTTKVSVDEANKFYAKPESYTGNRNIYDSGLAKRNVKLESFSNASQKVYDPYTGKELVLTQAEAKARFGSDWQNHVAEGDHIRPIENVFNEYKDSIWNSNDDIRETVNSKGNMQTVSRKFNNAKRNKTNDFVNDKEYTNKTGLKFKRGGKKKAIKADANADQFIKSTMKEKALKNAFRTGHKSGSATATNAAITTATISSIQNITAVIKGEKEPKEALKDVVKDSSKAATSGYLLGGGLTTLTHTLTGSSSTFIKTLAKSNVPANIISTVIVTGDTISRYAKGEISTQECIIELGEKGLNVATTGYSMAMGQALIPIPIVGAAVGALIGSLATSQLYNEVINALQNNNLEHKERERMIQEAKILKENLINYREELEFYINNYFSECEECFSFALTNIKTSLINGDANGVIAGANKITNYLGGNVKYRNMKEFKDYLFDDETDEL